MNAIVLIPARMASARLPGKPPERRPGERSEAVRPRDPKKEEGLP